MIAIPASVQLDHAGILGADIDSMVESFRDAGFVVTDPQELMGQNLEGRAVGLGQWSSHVLFADSYIELTAVPGRPEHHHLARYFELGDGPRLILFATPSAIETHSRIQRASASNELCSPHPIQAASRTDPVSGDEARFSWFGLDADAFPEALVAFVEHKTPELVFKPPVEGHPNGTRALEGVVIWSAEPERTVARYEALGPKVSTRLDERAAITVVDNDDWLPSHGSPTANSVVALRITTAADRVPGLGGPHAQIRTVQGRTGIVIADTMLVFEPESG